MELKETTRDHSGVHNLTFQNDNEDIGIVNQEDLRDSSQRIKNSEHEKNVHTNQEDEFINIESDLHENKHDSADDEKLRLRGLLEKKYHKACNFCKKHRTRINYVMYRILITVYLAAVIAACSLNFQRALPLFIITVLAIFFVCWDFLVAKYEDRIAAFFSPGERYLEKQWFWLKWVLCAALIVAIIFWLIFDTAKQGSHQLISFGGLVMYILLMFIFSKYPTRVAWRPVFSGIVMQFILGLLILRTKVGFDVFNWLGIQIQTFLEYSDTGAKFVFGDKYTDHFFAFKVLPIVVFFSTVMSMLYHIGFMQWLVGKVGWIMQIFMGTTPVESLVAAGNIFVGQTESPLLVRPYLPYITKSELHAVMTAGFSTIAGSVLGAYISFGVSASHLLTASVMSAPASLATSKLFWPETEKPEVTLKSGLKMAKGESNNLLEAASQGASSSILLVANIAVNLISFLALLAFIDSALSWVGNLFDYPQLNFENICAYVFMPFSFMMGVDWEDSFIVGGLLGYKTFFNEFVAYERLSKLIHNREKGGSMYVNGVKQYMTVRSETIATYALCGFANFGSLGMVIGSLTSMAPSKKKEIANGAFRAMIAGTVACFMTACIAGMLAVPDVEVPCHILSQNAFNSTSSPANSTELVKCCQQTFTSANSSLENFPGGNYTLNFWKKCCQILNRTTLNCT
ncbi:solute carrier family 28 member 3 [Gallus gallus]|uniref:Sodium/nucleoside cotransporter n=1 Tax=Gallus gallus TaxID=9031 RepID=A0A8V0YTQ7_CHICK|nr:solute carrier family 28 member 3 [Gallus gallus]XP_040512394.1 solute carrier family 28 member 3 [Gallus gallus]XP_046792761.1 solute carrier family 28 member 3 [Gallus gallus]XP_046792762.1 solute carrier family 28 member 3 [Gallus gallus]